MSGGECESGRSAGEARRSAGGALAGEVELVDQPEVAAPGPERGADQAEAAPPVHADGPAVAVPGGERDPFELAGPGGGEDRVEQGPAGAVPAGLGQQEHLADLAAGRSGALERRRADDPAAGVGGDVEGAAAGR